MNTHSIMYKTDTKVQEPRNSVRKDPPEPSSAVGIGGVVVVGQVGIGEPNVSVGKGEGGRAD